MLNFQAHWFKHFFCVCDEGGGGEVGCVFYDVKNYPYYLLVYVLFTNLLIVCLSVYVCVHP